MIKHNIDPVYDKDSRVLILGSFPSPKSRERRFFYGHPQNRMWKVLAQVFDEQVPETNEERRDFLLQHHIAMWDVLSACEISGADDASIKNETPNDLSTILNDCSINAVFTAGSKAAQCYRKYDEKKYDIPHIRLPSTSPANAAASPDRLAAKYLIVRLFILQDRSYADFQRKLIPTAEAERIIGVRVPELRKIAKSFCRQPGCRAYLDLLPHGYYDENMLHGLLISEMKDYDECVEAVDRFLPFVDNWAVCDIMSPKVFKKHTGELIKQIMIWTGSEHSFTCRFGLGMLMKHYLDDDFRPEYLQIVSEVKSDDYYVNMMIAWFFATALAKQWDAAIFYIEKKKLEDWIHKKTIQKACESYRITDDQKKYLRSLK